MRKYPLLSFDLSALENNVREVTSRCKKAGISVCGVVKGCSGMPEAARIMAEHGAAQIGSSRIEQIAACKKANINASYLLLRIPSLSEVPDVVEYCDISLQTERQTLKAINRECEKKGKTHSVIIMADLGDLREGFWDKDELTDTCLFTEKELPSVHLLGIGVNLGCYGSVIPTVAKMNELSILAERVEAEIGRKLEIVSGGETSAFGLVHKGVMPKKINHLRMGECLLIAKELKTVYGINDIDYLDPEVFTLTAEVIELKNKPSYPQGELGVDAFAKKREYKDIGIRKRALLNVGRADVGDAETLIPHEKGVFVVGASSDHLILDVTDCEREINVGDTVSFSLYYTHLLYLSSRPDVTLKIIK